MAYLCPQCVSKENKGLCLYEIYLLGGWDNSQGKCDMFSAYVVGGMWIRKQNPVEDQGEGSRMSLQTEERTISAACVNGERVSYTQIPEGKHYLGTEQLHFFFLSKNPEQHAA